MDSVGGIPEIEENPDAKGDVQRRKTMFCSNCGKQLVDGVKFCKYCGASIGVQGGAGNQMPSGNTYNHQAPPTNVANQNANDSGHVGGQPSLEPRTIWLIAMTAITVFVALGFFWSVVEVSFYSDAKFGFKDATDITRLMKATGMVGFGTFLVWVATIASVISALFGAGFLWELYNGQRGEDLSGFAKNSAICQLVALIILVFLTFMVNMQGKEYGDFNILKITVMGWFLVILCLVNIYYVINRYEEECFDYVAKSSATTGYGQSGIIRVCIRCETNYSIGSKCPKCGGTEARDKGSMEKVCMICKTSYSLGNKCPKCGSKSTQ